MQDGQTNHEMARYGKGGEGSVALKIGCGFNISLNK